MDKACAKHILIVEDSSDNQLLLKTVLEAKGYTTHCTSNGQEALTLLKSSAHLPNAILLDLRMPVMDGFTFRQLQKADPRLKQIPVVILSGEQDIAGTQAKTDSDVLRKPFKLSLLMEIIEKNLQLH